MKRKTDMILKTQTMGHGFEELDSAMRTCEYFESFGGPKDGNAKMS